MPFTRSDSYKTAKNETKTKGDKIDRSSNKTDEMQIAKKYLYTLDVHTYGYIFFAAFSKQYCHLLNLKCLNVNFYFLNLREKVVFVDNLLYKLKLPL